MQISICCPWPGSISMVFRLIFTFIRILFLLICFLVENQGTSNLVGSDTHPNSSPPEQVETLSPTRVAAKPAVTAAHDLARSSLSAYRSSEARLLAALETREMEIVERFGDWHGLLGLQGREQFWKEGFEMTSRKDFRLECSVLHVPLIGLTSAIAQVKVSYKGGIRLKDG